MDTKAHSDVCFFHRVELIEAPSRECGLSPFSFLRLGSPFASPLRCREMSVRRDIYLCVRAVTSDLPNHTWTHRLSSRPRAEKATGPPLFPPLFVVKQ